MAMITDPDAFFTQGCGRCSRFATADSSARLWAEGLARLRALCRDAGLDEQAKWGHPCYVRAGRNIALIGAFRSDFRLNFMNPALLQDPDAVLEKQGPASRHPGTIRFTDAAQVERLAPVISAYLREAMGYAEAGIRPPRDAAEIDIPPELADALDADPELAEAFAAFTPGRQRSYAINLNAAKKPETRIARIAKFRPGILAGTGANER